MREGEYDVAGFIVGVVSQAEDHRRPERHSAGDVLIALPSSGLHTNGYSLARRIVFDVLGPRRGQPRRRSWARPSAQALLRTASVVPAGSRARCSTTGWIKGMAHITGGGITENLPRTLPEGPTFSLDRQSWTMPPLFPWLQRAGGLEDAEMFRAFNMGVGHGPGVRAGVTPGRLSALGRRPGEIGMVDLVVPVVPQISSLGARPRRPGLGFVHCVDVVASRRREPGTVRWRQRQAVEERGSRVGQAAPGPVLGAADQADGERVPLDIPAVAEEADPLPARGELLSARRPGRSARLGSRANGTAWVAVTQCMSM